MSKILLRFWDSWKIIVGKIGDFQIRVVFSLFYYLLISPFGFVVTFFKDYLERKETPRWQKLEGSFETIEDLKNQS